MRLLICGIILFAALVWASVQTAPKKAEASEAVITWNQAKDDALTPACVVVERVGRKVVAIHVDLRGCEEQGTVEIEK